MRIELSEKLLRAAQNVTNDATVFLTNGCNYYQVDVDVFEDLRKVVRQISDEAEAEIRRVLTCVGCGGSGYVQTLGTTAICPTCYDVRK